MLKNFLVKFLLFYGAIVAVDYLVLDNYIKKEVSYNATMKAFVRGQEDGYQKCLRAHNLVEE